MNMIEKEIKSTICEITCLNSAEITNNTTIKELGLDSMDFLDFIYRLEEKLNKNIHIKQINFKEIKSFTIQDLIYEIQKL